MMAVGNMFDNGKSQAGAAVFPASGFITAVKSFKDTFLMLGVNAGAMILDGDTNGLPIVSLCSLFSLQVDG